MQSSIPRYVPMSKINDTLYVGGAEAVDEVEGTNVKCVICFQKNPCIDPVKLRTNGIRFYHLPIEDASDANITKLVKIAHRIACRYRIGRPDPVGVLFQCRMGISRSVTAVLYHIMSTEQKSLEQAFDDLQTIRPISSPNKGFWNQLRLLEIELFIRRLSARLYRIREILRSHAILLREQTVAEAIHDESQEDRVTSGSECSSGTELQSEQIVVVEP
jgi:protein-tyrosine phosphatase